jgi:peptidyl-prolyl cis-trans isomerase B (cyclophilin B)
MKKVLALIAIMSLSLALLVACGGSDSQDNYSDAGDTPEVISEALEFPTEEPADLWEGDMTKVKIEFADIGDVVVELNREAAPATVDNFVKLVEDGFYDGLGFHRIIENFMIQGGDPTGTGMGGADENIVGEFTANGHMNPISHLRGVISMARSQAYDSASSQFFIVHQDSTFLDGEYAAFGRVVEGMDVVDQIAENTPAEPGSGSVDPENHPKISRISILD